MRGISCQYCGEVHWNGETCAKREKASHTRVGLQVIDDEHFCLAGKVYPGLNGDRPLDSKKGFNDELKAKGLVHSSPKEMRDGPAKKNDVLLAEQIQETYGIPAHEARQYARDAIAGRA